MNQTASRETTPWLDRINWPAVRYAALVLAVVFASLVLVSCAVWQTVTPQWKSPGYPQFIGYGKNVEHLALALSIATALGVSLLLPRRAIRWLVICAAMFALLVAVNLSMPRPKLALPLMLFTTLAYFAWWYARSEEKTDQRPAAAALWPWFISAGLLMLAGLVAFVQFIAPRPLDLFHQGEVLLCARDWLAGGKPYQTMFWPHGMHDSWLPAQISRWTGNQGVGIYMLMFCIGGVSGAVSCWLLAWNLIRRHAEASLVTLLAVAILPMAVYSLGWCLFGILALHVLANHTSRRATALAGALLAWAFLWRLDTGTFCAVAAIGFLIFDEYYTRSYRCGASFWHSLRDVRRLRWTLSRLTWLAAGGLSLFAITRLTLGLPTLTMLNMALIELPRYHADNTGVPLPLPVALMQSVGIVYSPGIAWATALFLLFAASLVVFLMIKARERRLALETPRGRFLLVASLVALLHVKVGIDRSDVPHLFTAMTPLLFVAWFDLLGWFSRQLREGWQRVSLVAGGTGVCFGLLVLGTLGNDFSGRPLRNHLKNVVVRTLDADAGLATLAQCLQPTKSWPDMLDPAADPQRPQIQQAVQQLRRILDGQRVGQREFLALHSAPMLYPLTDRQSPTKYYLPGWAMNDRMQREAVRELEISNIRAVLRTNGLGSTMPLYDIPDEHRVPHIHRFVEQATRNCVVYPTLFGPLYLRCDSHVAEYRLLLEEAQPAIETPAGRVPLLPEGSLGNLDACQIEGETLRIGGWAGSAELGAAAEQVLVFCGQKCLHASFPHEPRADVVGVFNQPGLLESGVNLQLPASWLESTEASQLRVVALCQGKAALLTVGGLTVAQRSGQTQPLK